MRKIIAILMVLCLLPAIAIAETSEADNIVTFNFEGFTMDMPKDIAGYLNERAEGGVYFQVYPEYNEAELLHPNLNVCWTPEVDDLSKKEDLSGTAQVLLDGIISTFEASGYSVSDAQIVAFGVDEHEGKQAFSVVFNFTVDYTAVMGNELTINQYCMQTYVADEDFGTYVFNITAETIEKAQPCIELMNTIKWTD